MRRLGERWAGARGSGKVCQDERLSRSGEAHDERIGEEGVKTDINRALGAGMTEVIL